MLPVIKGFFWKEIKGIHFLAEEGTERVKYITVPDPQMPGVTEVKLCAENKIIAVLLSEQKAFEFCAYLIETQQAKCTVDRSK